MTQRVKITEIPVDTYFGKTVDLNLISKYEN